MHTLAHLRCARWRKAKQESRLFEELDKFSSISEMDSPSKFAKLHGVSTSVSPITITLEELPKLDQYQPNRVSYKYKK